MSLESIGSWIAAFETVDLLAIGIVCIVWPLFGQLIEARQKRRIRAGIPGARRETYLLGMADLWLIAALVTAAWLLAGRPLSALGFHDGFGWAAMATLGVMALVAVYFSVQIIMMLTRPALREEWAKGYDEARESVPFLPANPRDAALFGALGTTAGITEEIIFRGFLINVLALAMPLWGAAVASLALFVVMHAYQGRQGMIQVAIIGAVITGLFVAGAPLQLLIVLHVVIDLFSALLMGIATAGGKRALEH